MRAVRENRWFAGLFGVLAGSRVRKQMFLPAERVAGADRLCPRFVRLLLIDATVSAIDGLSALATAMPKYSALAGSHAGCRVQIDGGCWPMSLL
jgi:hypothetical protein